MTLINKRTPFAFKPRRDVGSENASVIKKHKCLRMFQIYRKGAVTNLPSIWGGMLALNDWTGG